MNVTETVLHAVWTAALNRGDQAQAALAELALNAIGEPPKTAVSVAGAAVWYANRGLRVFPLQPGSKQPLRGSHGVKDATDNQHELAEWFGAKMNPREPWNLAVACGDPFDVLDIDGGTGAASFLGVLGDGAWLAVRAVCETPRGLHLWVPAVAGAKNSKNEATGFDYRTTGGYVVVPPSHIDGTLYRWLLPPAR